MGYARWRLCPTRAPFFIDFFNEEFSWGKISLLKSDSFFSQFLRQIKAKHWCKQSLAKPTRKIKRLNEIPFTLPDRDKLHFRHLLIFVAEVRPSLHHPPALVERITAKISRRLEVTEWIKHQVLRLQELE